MGSFLPIKTPHWFMQSSPRGLYQTRDLGKCSLENPELLKARFCPFSPTPTLSFHLVLQGICTNLNLGCEEGGVCRHSHNGSREGQEWDLLPNPTCRSSTKTPCYLHKLIAFGLMNRTHSIFSYDILICFRGL